MEFSALAINQLVNHLDKIQVMSNGGYKTKAIIRTGIGVQRPLHPQHQHVGDFTEAIRACAARSRSSGWKNPRTFSPPMSGRCCVTMDAAPSCRVWRLL